MTYSYPQSFPKITGMVVLEVIGSNPNGDPSAEGQPREQDGYGLISHVAFKSRIRELVHRDHPIWEESLSSLGLNKDEHQVLFKKGQTLEEVNAFLNQWKNEGFIKDWHMRLNGHFVTKKSKVDGEDPDKHITTGLFVVGQGYSLNRIKIDSNSITRVVAVGEKENGQDKGGAIGSYSVVRYGIYCQPFFIHPTKALIENSQTRYTDVELLRRLLPYVGDVRSAARSQINVRQVLWYEHSKKIGDVADWKLISTMKPALLPNREGDKAEDYVFFDSGSPSKVAEDLIGDAAKKIHDFAI